MNDSKTDAIPIRSRELMIKFMKIGRSEIDIINKYIELEKKNSIEGDCLQLLIGIYALMVNQNLQYTKAALDQFETWVILAESIANGSKKFDIMERITLEFRNISYRPKGNLV